MAGDWIGNTPRLLAFMHSTKIYMKIDFLIYLFISETSHANEWNDVQLLFTRISKSSELHGASVATSYVNVAALDPLSSAPHEVGKLTD